MNLQELFGAFFKGFFRWIGVGLALLIIFAFFAALSGEASLVKIRSLPPKGFENIAWKGQSAIALIRIDSEIGKGYLVRERVRRLLESCQSDQLKGKIRAILLEIDTPGGGAIESEGIYELLSSYKQLYNIPIYAFVDGYCASGGYMIACAADKIVTTNYSVIGSVGVIGHLLNYSDTLDKLGVKALIFKRGLGKDALDPMKPVDETERLAYEPLLDADYARFLSIVSKARPLLTERVLRQEVGARAFACHEAHRLGYVDEINWDRSMAVTALAAKAGLESDFALIELMPATGWSDMFKEASYSGIQTYLHQMLTPSWQACLK